MGPIRPLTATMSPRYISAHHYCVFHTHVASPLTTLRVNTARVPRSSTSSHNDEPPNFHSNPATCKGIMARHGCQHGTTHRVLSVRRKRVHLGTEALVGGR